MGLNIILLACKSNKHEGDLKAYPSYLSEQKGKPIVQKHVESFDRLNPNRIICIFSREDAARYHLDNLVAQISPVAMVLKVYGETKGAACTALLASHYIDNDEELLIVNVNELIDADLGDVVNHYRASAADAGVLTFESIHPRYSFARIDGCKNVVEVAEKNPISRNALAGFFWFSSGKDFVGAAKRMIRNDVHVSNIYYIAPSLNELILNHKKIFVFEIDGEQYQPLKDF